MKTSSERSAPGHPGKTNGVVPSPMLRSLEKSPTGIAGFDLITGGGLPKGRPTLVCGKAGAGKTMFGIEFLAQGALNFDEPGVLMTFEETSREIEQNTRAWHFDMERLIAEKKIAVDNVYIEPKEIEEAGDYDLEGLFIRLGAAIDSVGAKRVVLDTIEALFSGFSGHAVLRAEFRRLFRWLKERDVTVVVTAERGDAEGLTRNGIEEYVADCVVLLDQRLEDQLATRRLRIVKYRGTAHGTSEYPFLITPEGFSIAPLNEIGLSHRVSNDRVTTGIPALDVMLGGEGFYRGSTVLVSGSAGSGKSAIAASFVAAACKRKERCLYLSFEESSDQIVRNMTSMGIDLKPFIDQGLLQIQPARPSGLGLEAHLAAFVHSVDAFDPHVVILDPVTSFLTLSRRGEVVAMLIRMIDYLKSRGTTTILTSLVQGGTALETSDTYISSLADTWLSLHNVESEGERGRTLYVLKSRGMAHSNQVREFVLGRNGIELVDVYAGPDGVLIGSARDAQASKERAEALAREQRMIARDREVERKRVEVEAKIALLRSAYEADVELLKTEVEQERVRTASAIQEQRALSERRQSGPAETKVPVGSRT